MYDIAAILIVLFLGWVRHLLFNLGMFVSFRKVGASSYGGAFANGWLLGWLFTLPLAFVWSPFVVVVVLMFDYSGSSEVGLFVFFLSLAIALFGPGVNVALRLLLDHPSLPRGVIAQAVLGWTVPLPVLLGVVYWYWNLFVFGSDLWRSLYGYQTVIGVSVGVVCLLVGWFVGREVMALTSAGGLWMQGADERADVLGDEEAARSFSGALQHGKMRVWGVLGVLGRPFGRVVVGWGIAWVAFVWLMVPQIRASGGLSASAFLFYMIGSVALMAVLVSAGAGGVATLLMRGDGVSWGRSLEDAKVWFLGGLLGWVVATPVGYIFYFLYVRLYLMLFRGGVLPRFFRPFEQMSLWVAGFLGLVIAFRFVRGRFAGRV